MSRADAEMLYALAEMSATYAKNIVYFEKALGKILLLSTHGMGSVKFYFSWVSIVRR